ncbi:MAG TPA: hypothetical protein DCM07_06055 [Planctomycetaceae bacterium]|uniref:DUF4350 domain-containing protein n=2 Tax=Gimesia TaxID=1649453 RepID=UPI000C3E5A89|nr:DUF4350 domain-containing protein [Gimesia sp.]MAX38175.1 hypothetical protein [Gimesia sp.]HAH44415.1 hypothetical protein [Planctomycetaceae bacterium]|tara:strand:+ start:11895 stop:14204 length:2310 start_codon:yes stop_codon:yes gene_type:complete
MKSSLFVRFSILLVLLLSILLNSSFSLAADPQTDTLEVTDLQVGFDGLFKVGRWVPVYVELKTEEPLEVQLSVITLSPDGNPTEVPSQVYSLKTPGTYQLFSEFKSGLLDSPLKIRLRDAETQSILKEFSYAPQSRQNRFMGIGLKQSVELWATIGAIGGLEPVSSDSLPELDQNLDQYVTLIEDQASLPESAYGYDTLDTLVVDADFSSGTQKNKAIREWVANGGHLVLCVGEDGDAYQQSEYASWVPVKILGTSNVRDLSSLELFAAVRSRIRGVATASRIEISTGEILATGLDGPLLVRVPYGLGIVTFLALDLNTSPLTNWEGLTNLGPKLATRARQPSASSQQNAVLGKRISQTGISELETQVFHSQQNFPGIQRPSHWWVMALILIYLLVIGPLDYFLVHKILKKPHITWFTFPAMVLIAVAWGGFTALQDNGSVLHSTQLNVIDYDVTAGQLRGRFYLNLYSPETRRYQVKVKSSVPAESKNPSHFPTHLSWNGLPETTFAGMYRSAEGTITGPAYQFSAQSKGIENLPILKWGTKSLLAEWTQQQTDLVTSKLTGNNLGQLSGTLTHQFSSPLKDWVLAYGNRVYLPVINPEQLEASYIPVNQAWSINGPRIESRNIKGYLTRSVSRRIEQKGQNNATIVTVQTDYNPFAKEAYEILKILTFHEMSGGYGYTGLSNISGEQLDLTEQLRLGRAVLFARLDTPLSVAELDQSELDQENQDTYIRIVIPVSISTEIQYELPSLDKKDKETQDQQDTPSGSDNE